MPRNFHAQEPEGSHCPSYPATALRGHPSCQNIAPPKVCTPEQHSHGAPTHSTAWAQAEALPRGAVGTQAVPLSPGAVGTPGTHHCRDADRGPTSRGDSQRVSLPAWQCQARQLCTSEDTSWPGQSQCKQSSVIQGVRGRLCWHTKSPSLPWKDEQCMQWH